MHVKVAILHLQTLKLTDPMQSSYKQTFKSLPEYPSVAAASSSTLKSGARSSSARMTFMILARLSASGKSIINLQMDNDSSGIEYLKQPETQYKVLYTWHLAQNIWLVMTKYLRGNLRITASSRSNGRLVAPKTSTRSLSLVRKPSQLPMNSFFNFRIAECSVSFPRRPSMLSTCIKRD